MSKARESFVELCYSFLDALNEFKAWVEEYDEGFPITKDTSACHRGIISLRNKIFTIMAEYEEDSDSDFMSFSE